MIIVFEDVMILRLNVRAARSQCVSFLRGRGTKRTCSLGANWWKDVDTFT